jgi:hypothetical protein
MRIHEIINEDVKCQPGWQESSYSKTKNDGYVILSYRLDRDCEIDEILFVYYNKNLVVYDNENEHGWIASIKVKNNRVIIYDYFSDSEMGKNIGEYSSIAQVKTLFDDLISLYLK